MEEFVKHKYESERKDDKETEAWMGSWAKVNLPISLQDYTVDLQSWKNPNMNCHNTGRSLHA